MRNKGSRDGSHRSKNSTGRGYNVGFEDSNAGHNIGGGYRPGRVDGVRICGREWAQ